MTFKCEKFEFQIHNPSRTFNVSFYLNKKWILFYFIQFLLYTILVQFS